MFLRVPLLIALLFLSTKQTNVYVDEGLCVHQRYTDCDDQVQLMGVCCRSRRGRGRALKYYPNECQACKQGCRSYLFKNNQSIDCSEPEFAQF